MKRPWGLKKINNLGNEIKEKVEKIIQKAMESDHIISYPLKEFNVEEIDALSEYAKENRIHVSLSAEHSNFYQGVLVQLLKKDLIAEFAEHL